MALPKLVDNIKVSLGSVLKSLLPNYKEVSIATGYWDLPGTAELIDQLKDYSKIRLLIGQEPLSNRYQKELKLDFNSPDNLFPEKDFINDLEEEGKKIENKENLKKTAEIISDLINKKVLEVKVYRKSTLHAKAYIFGNIDSNNSVGILGSSNFTKAGLYTNTELDSVETDYRIVNWEPKDEKQENGYFTWFDSLWNDEKSIDWTGEFKQVVQNSPLGNLTYGPYDSYIKTLMEVYPDEMIPPKEVNDDVLFSFQNRNAGILINKLEKNGVAILADSVGLGKTITAGEVIKFYLNKPEGKSNILVIAPAALKQQWKDDLASILHVDYVTNHDYEIISEQDTNAINQIYEEYNKNWRRQRSIDLFVIDEAHNLRSSSGKRHDAILNLLKQHKNAKILLLTATPINNSLLDIANLLQLAMKGRLTSVNVSYPRPDGSGTEHIDFFEALKRIESSIKKADKNGENVQDLLKKMQPTIHDGLMHYLVRSTRQGVEAEGGIIDKKTGKAIHFPQSQVTTIKYRYNQSITSTVFNIIGQHIFDCFEGIDPRRLNLEMMSNFTEETMHPLDFLNEGITTPERLVDRFDISKRDACGGSLFLDTQTKNLVPNILQIIFTFGFTPYRPSIYKHQYYGKTVKELKELKIPFENTIQFTAHNVLQVTWLKRMESSAAALMYSLNNYEARLNLFEKYLNKGFIVSLSDASLLESDYGNGEDIDQAFSDYEKYLKEKEKIIEEGGDPAELKKQGIEKVNADPSVFKIDKMQHDLERERKLISLLKGILQEVIKPQNDIKAKMLHDEIAKTFKEGKYGHKVLIFSFFADTINYLKKEAENLFGDLESDFPLHAGFITGQCNQVEDIVRRFSPKSKHYEFKKGEHEINFLFSTDVLSEGQNLQDAGYLINYDLHWNPVRMIQRNGRINRLGSPFSEVKVSNMQPTDELEMYLNLVHRLERKISTIRNTVGLDQGVLSSVDVNPIEFIEKYYKTGALPPDQDDFWAASGKHIMNFRSFLAENDKNSEHFKFIQSMPVGKWNYLPKDTSFKGNALSLVKIRGEGENSHTPFFSNLFLKITSGDSTDNLVTYIDSTTALDFIEAKPEDNSRKLDRIQLDRTTIQKRSLGEAKRQAVNPDQPYKLKPRMKEALLSLSSVLQKKEEPPIDFIGIIQRGVTTTDLKKDLEKILRQVNIDKAKGTINGTTLNDFLKVFKKIKSEESENKIVLESEVTLYYAKE